MSSAGQRNGARRQRFAKSGEAFDGGTESRRAGDVADALVAQRNEVVRHLGDREPVVGDDHARWIVELRVRDAHVGAVGGGERARELVVLGDRRQQDHAAQLLAFDEAPHARDEVRLLAVAGMDDDFVLGIAHGIERAFHQVHDVLRVRVVVDQPDQEGLAKCEAARLRIRHVAELVDDRLDARARRFLHQRRLVDDARNGLLRDAREPRDVVDGGVTPRPDTASPSPALAPWVRARLPAAFFRVACHGR